MVAKLSAMIVLTFIVGLFIMQRKTKKQYLNRRTTRASSVASLLTKVKNNSL